MVVVGRLIAVMLLMLAAGCGTEESSPREIAGPPRPPEILEARWLQDPAELRAAALHAFGNPLVQALMPRRDDPRFQFTAEHVLRAEGRLADGATGRLTLLPYLVDGDSTHASFVTLLEQGNRVVAETCDLIVGREPTSLETGFEPIALDGQYAWLRPGDALLASGDADAAGRSPMRVRRDVWIGCFLANAGTWCEAAGSLARQAAPAVPAAYAVGCTAGTAAAAIYCLLVASK